jgi:hypothetical protein
LLVSVGRCGCAMSPLDVIRLPAFTESSRGWLEITVALINGPVVSEHRDFAGSPIREIPGQLKGIRSLAGSVASAHRAFVAGMLSAQCGSAAPAIRPGCTPLLRHIIAEAANGKGHMPSAASEELAQAIIDGGESGACVISLSAALLQPSSKDKSKLEQALDYASRWHYRDRGG